METLRAIHQRAILVLLALSIALCFVQQVRINRLSEYLELSDRQISELQSDLDWLKEQPVADHPSIEDEIDSAMSELPDEAIVAFGSPAQDLRKEWASKYNKARKIKLLETPYCEACGYTHDLETHHVISVSRIFTEKLDHSLIADPKNLIVLDRRNGTGCHWRFGHFSRSWQESNPNVRKDAAKNLKQVQSKTKSAI